MSFLWYQRSGGEDAWLEALASHRKKIIEEVRPAFITVLDAHSSPDDTFTRDDYAKMRYSGPLYFDWDAEDVAETIPKFQQFIIKLMDLGVNVRSVRMYATGGRGFHMEIPEPVFMPKVPKTGVTLLPYVYREMAMELVVDTMDMRVYTGRKGRMWRVPGIQRSNGKFKVPITLDEALAMTPELYDQVCSAPVPEPERELPELATGLAALFVKSQAKLEESVKRRGKASNEDTLLAAYKGEFPATVQRIMAGEGLAPGIGFHKVAMQLAIMANAMGKTADELVERCEGLCKSHESDGSRYNSPRKRKEELRRMWEYTHDNPCYSFSRGGIRSLLDVNAPSSDLDGVASSVGIGHVPDNDDDDATDLPSELAQEVSIAQNSLLEGMFIDKSGIYKKTAEGARSLSNLSFRKPSMLIDAEEGMVVGFEADIVADNEKKGRHMVPLKNFVSRGALSAYCSGFGAVFSGTDTQAGVLQVMLSRSAKKGDRVLYIVRKEGLDVVQNPETKDRVVKDVIWASPEGVLTHNPDMTGKYKFQPYVTTNALINTDIHNAPLIQATPDTREWLHALLNMNSEVTIAQMLGWFVSAFHRQFYHATHKQFPLLHPNGPAGCGKTLTTGLLGRLFHNVTPIKMVGCSPGSSTAYSLKGLWTGSASVPVLMDEYKPAEMGAVRTEFLVQHFRMLYNQAGGASGGMSKGGAESSFRDVAEYTYSAPTAFLAESQEMQTAIVQRTLPVAFNPYDSRSRTHNFEIAQRGADLMPQLGALLLRFSLQETVESRREAIEPWIRDLRASYDPGVHDRQVFNLAVVLEGLNFLDRCLISVFGEEFRGDFDMLKNSVYTHKAEINVASMSEAAKVMNDLSLMSRTETPDSEAALRETYEYLIDHDGTLHLKMREAYVKYSVWCKRKGFTPLYASADSFMSAMGKFPATVDKVSLKSPLKTSGQSRVFRFDIQKMSTEGVEMFKSKADA